MKRTTIMAMMEGQKQRLNESMIFWKSTGDIDRAGDEFTTTEYTSKKHEFYDGEIPFTIEKGQNIRPLVGYHKGVDVIIGLEVNTATKVIIDEISDYDVQRLVRPLIAKEVAKHLKVRHVSEWQIDCKLTKLYLEEKLTWDEYCKAVEGSC